MYELTIIDDKPALADLIVIKVISDKFDIIDPVALKQEAKFCNEFEDTKIIPSLSPNDKTYFRDCKSVVKIRYLKPRRMFGKNLSKTES